MAPSVDVVIAEARTWRFFFRGQALHFAALVLLWVVAEALAAPAFAAAPAARWWFRLGLTVTVVHQAVVWLVFRGQLGWGLLTRWWGDRALRVWSYVFLPLLLLRPVAVLGCGLADSGSLQMPARLALVLGLVLLVPAVLTLWSVHRYFGVERALGGDHFEVFYRTLPPVRRGAFAWTGNAMYAFAFLILWSVALLTRSHAALVLALFQHAAIWAHFHGTERPDLELMHPRA